MRGKKTRLKVYAVINLTFLLGSVFQLALEPLPAKAAPPSNTSAATAIDIAALPYTTTQNVHDAGTTYSVWYKYTAQPGDKVIGVFGFGYLPVGSYKPTTRIFQGPADSLTNLFIAADNRPLQFPVTAGITYFIQFLTSASNPSPAELKITVQKAPSDPIVEGSILVNDDTSGFPMAALSASADFTVLDYVQDIVAGEGGDILHSEPVVILLEDRYNSDKFVLYDSDFSLINSYPGIAATGNAIIRANQTTHKFYIGTSGGGLTKAAFSTMSDAGVIGSVVELPNAGPTALAGNNDDTILYYAGNGSGSAIQRWDLVNNVQMADFLPAVVGRSIPDILILEDNSIVIGYYDSANAIPLYVARYQSDGTLLNTYNFVDTAGTTPRMAYALDSPNSFWVWTHSVAEEGISHFNNVKVSDGTILTKRKHSEFEGGASQAAETDTPLSYFGHSFSCPFLIMPDTAATTGTIEIIKDTVLDNAQDFSFTSATLTPSSFDLDDDADGTLSNTQTFSNISAGAYDIVESAASGFTLSSINCVDPDSGTSVNLGAQTATIDLDAGETVTCTFTNDQNAPPPSGGGGGGGSSSNPPPATGTIIIIEDTVPDNAQDFDFSASLDPKAFKLDDDSDPALFNMKTYGDVAAGIYTFAEQVPALYTLTSIVCIDPTPNTVANLSWGMATINLASGETVVCTFINNTDIVSPPLAPPASATPNPTPPPLPRSGIPLSTFVFFLTLNFGLWLTFFFYDLFCRNWNAKFLIINFQTVDSEGDRWLYYKNSEVKILSKKSMF